MSVTTTRLFDGLPAYIGGKRRLAPLIFALLAKTLPREYWRGARLIDPFCGGCSVALYAKAQGFDVVASDVSRRAFVVARALIENSTDRLSRSDVRRLFATLPQTDDHVEEPSILTGTQLRFLRHLRTSAEATNEPKRSLLLSLLVKTALGFFPMSAPSATDAKAAASDDFDRVSSRRLAHYLRAQQSLTPDRVWRAAESINASVVPGRGRALRADARLVLAETRSEVAYLDPPYAGTTRYDRFYAPLDALLGEALSMVASPTLDELLDAARDTFVVVLSYGGPTVTLDSLTELVARHRTIVDAREVPYPHLQSVSKEVNRGFGELIIVARR